MNKPPFKKILIANRGEIAIRIARAATELAIPTVGIFSFEDRFSLHRYKTDESYRIGVKGKPIEAYLNFEEIIHLAKNCGADAIHPGYGFLSENAQFAKRCHEENIRFIGPSPEVLSHFGDKVEAKRIAKEAGLTLIPGTEQPVENLEEAKAIAKNLGYPVTLKAVAGGGGRGIRMVDKAEDLEEALRVTRAEAALNFGLSDVYLEKRIVDPKHIEVQILADHQGNTVHLFERDCSIQRRNQKVVELAPAEGISQKTRDDVFRQAITVAKYVNYEGLGTVEFLVDREGNAYFLEVNPRIQVEHTVTEMITGVDLMQASILVASGSLLSDPRIGILSQASIVATGSAIQCRITTEDPQKNFAPDTGTLIAYRPAAGFGIRLDEGHATTGAEITPYFDSLLVKVTAWGKTKELATAKMRRSLTEFRIRGVKHNIGLLRNILNHQEFTESSFRTSFLENNQELFTYKKPKDRATKLLRYIAEVTVNNPHKLEKKKPVITGSAEKLLRNPSQPQAADTANAKSVFDKEGPDGLKKWIKQQKSLLLTDTTMRDAQQSLFATRLRTKDIIAGCPFYREHASQFFSLEVWGGATFDTTLRFLKEDPWERLARIREKVPNILLQMLYRGDNAVGYTSYPDWVIKDFIKEARRVGLDIFRIFDCLNQPKKMQKALEEVKKQGGVAELAICYTGDISRANPGKFDLNYYKNLAKKLDNMGADILCIKDMAGLLKPHAATMLIQGLKEVTELPIHLHTHDTAGVGVAMLHAAALAGCEIVDGAISSMSGLTSQPSLNALIAILEADPQHRSAVNLAAAETLARYWQEVRSLYTEFDPGINSTSTDVYRHEIPGGQYSNLVQQAKQVGLGADEFHELTIRYEEVNDLLGDIIKVTPSSKAVGDLALLLHKQKLTGPGLLASETSLDYPDSIVALLRGELGEPEGGFPDKFKNLVLASAKNAPENKQSHLVKAKLKQDVEQILGRQPSEQDILSYALYPKVFEEFQAHCQQFGRETTALPTLPFFYGLGEGQEVEIDLEPGKTLFITLKGISNSHTKGKRKVFFKLNGFDRDVEIFDQAEMKENQQQTKADPRNEKHLAAPMPGKVIHIKVKEGQKVERGEVLILTESMKMEYAVTSKIDATIDKICVKVGDVIESGDLLIAMT